jgi:predicted PurR-regulated permease PerM
MNNSMSSAGDREFQKSATNAVRLGILFLLLYWCFLIIAPFIPLVLWGAIMAVAIYPLHQKLTAMTGGRNKLSAVLLVLTGLAVLITPVVMLSGSIVENVQGWAADIESGSLQVPPPNESVQDWPVIGEDVYSAWRLASENLTAAAERYAPQLEGLRDAMVSAAAGMGSGILHMILSLIIAGIFLASAEASAAGTRAVVNRLVGPRGPKLIALSEATVRSVAQGVLGVAIIQTLLSTIGLVVAGVPAAGVWAFLVLLVAIIQLPPILILAPIIVYVYSVADPVMATVFAVWSVLASSSDIVLKPLLLGRGLDVPMLVILIGAIGGMIYAGIVGLFVGAVILVLGYELLEFWIKDDEAVEKAAEPDTASDAV